MSELLLVPIACLTSALAAVMGMGGGILLIALMPGLVPAPVIIPPHAATQLASKVSRTAFSWHDIGRSIILAFVARAIMGARVGAAALLRRNTDRDWLVVNTAVYMALNHLGRVMAFMVIAVSFVLWWQFLSAMIVAGVCGSCFGKWLRHLLPKYNFQRVFLWMVTLLAVRLIVFPVLDLS